MTTLRTFLAVEVTDEIRSRAGDLAARLQESSAPVNWVSPENLHFTLNFLGEVRLEEVATICRRAEAVVADLAPFLVECRGAGAFPDLSRPRTLWLGVTDGHEALVELHARLADALDDLGFRRDRQTFHPHLTLGRLRGACPAELTRQLRHYQDFRAGGMQVEEVVVFSSTLRREGPLYEVLGRLSLAGA